MLVPLETLIDGVVHTLTDAVLPDLPTAFARGQLYAAVDVLRNMRDRIEEKTELRDAERESARAALERTAEALRSAQVERARADELTVLETAPAIDVLAQEIGDALESHDVPALRAALVAVLETLETLPAEIAAAARAPIAEHLAAQAMRDIAVLKPSMLSEISRG